jgi:hypothetical protein
MLKNNVDKGLYSYLLLFQIMKRDNIEEDVLHKKILSLIPLASKKCITENTFTSPVQHIHTQSTLQMSLTITNHHWVCPVFQQFCFLSFCSMTRLLSCRISQE